MVRSATVAKLVIRLFIAIMAVISNGFVAIQGINTRVYIFLLEGDSCHPMRA